MKKVMIFAGTRPEAIKVAPVVIAMRQSESLRPVLCSTGQHREMLAQALGDFGLMPDLSLDVMTDGQSLASLSGRLFGVLDEAIEAERPDCVLVQGDTTTVAIASLCAYYHGIPVAHLEAGLRSHDKRSPFPEEVNRRVAGVVADVHFAPTAKARENLLAENAPAETIHVVGNTVIDALGMIGEQVRGDDTLLHPQVQEARRTGKRIILVTGHRRESFGEGFHNICRAIRRLADTFEDVVFFYPVHLNPRVRESVHSLLSGHDRIILGEPLGYREFVAHMVGSHMVLTDSGGVQEEAPALGKPVLVMRDVTERTEGVEAGTARLVGTTEAGIVEGVTLLLDSEAEYGEMARAVNPYGDGASAKRVVAVLEEIL